MVETPQLKLFDEAPPAPRKPRTVKAAPAWTANTTKATCYECVRELAAGKWITAMRAQWRRTAGTDVALYCYEHATPLRDADHKAAARAA